MPEVGVRELKAHASEIVREVRERGAQYIVTYRGKPVGLLLPLDESVDEAGSATAISSEGAWATLTRLGEEIGREWQSDLTSGELLSSMRR
jgi:prevent-host-death family protein